MFRPYNPLWISAKRIFRDHRKFTPSEMVWFFSFKVSVFWRPKNRRYKDVVPPVSALWLVAGLPMIDFSALYPWLWHPVIRAYTWGKESNINKSCKKYSEMLCGATAKFLVWHWAKKTLVFGKKLCYAVAMPQIIYCFQESECLSCTFPECATVVEWVALDYKRLGKGMPERAYPTKRINVRFNASPKGSWK
jgi:hypothetical protein